MLVATDFVVWNKKLTVEDKNDVGVELSSLGEISARGVEILPSIIVTQFAFKEFLKDNNLSLQIKHLLGAINHERHESLSQTASYISGLVEKGVFPKKITEPLFSSLSKLKSKEISIQAYYFQGNKLIGMNKWRDIVGEAVLVEHIRFAWSHLFKPENLKKHTIHSSNHSSFSVVLAVIPQLKFELTGYVKTVGRTKSDYEIEAHSMVRFVYNKNAKQISEGQILPGGNKDALKASDVKKLLQIAQLAEKALYIPQILIWGKHQENFLVEKVIPLSDEISYNDTYSALTKNLSVHPGITIGRLRVIDEKDKAGLLVKDEIIMLKKLDRSMLSALKKAKGLIIEEEPHPEITFLLKNFGIPTIVRKKHHMLYSTGDVISLNATTGEIKRGSMLVS